MRERGRPRAAAPGLLQLRGEANPAKDPLGMVRGDRKKRRGQQWGEEGNIHRNRIRASSFALYPAPETGRGEERLRADFAIVLSTSK